MAQAQPNLRSLTGIRFFPAAMILWLHTLPLCSLEAESMWFRHFHYVSFFFMLSGFILTYGYASRFSTLSRREVWNYWVARWARIYPVYLLALAFGFGICTYFHVMKMVGYGASPMKALVHLTLLQNLIPIHAWYGWPFNPMAWSLCCEAFFYLLLPFLLVGLTTGSLARRGLVLLLCCSSWLVAMTIYHTGTGQLGLWMWLGVVFPPTRLLDFTAGILLALLFLKVQPRIGSQGRFETWFWTGMECGCLGLLYVCMNYVFPVENSLAGILMAWQGGFIPCFACILWTVALGRGWLSRFLAWGPLVYLGEVSFAIYMLQNSILLIFHHFFRTIDPNWVKPTYMLGVPLATLVMAILCHHFWERPLRNWIRRHGMISDAQAEQMPSRKQAHRGWLYGLGNFGWWKKLRMRSRQ